MSNTEPSEKWYYDACTLDSNLTTLGEIINYKNRCVTSYLAIGEAYGNSYQKGKLEYFTELMEKISKYIEIVGNDGIETGMKKVKDLCHNLSITDSMHVATALREGCFIFRTLDHDFDGFTNIICNELAHAHGMNRFKIFLMPTLNNRELFKEKKALQKIRKN